jgi:hypothetical protein
VRVLHPVADRLEGAGEDGEGDGAAEVASGSALRATRRVM